ncbi:hypothetical protein BLNAU_11958 [Blattamonas nauphoetae]|uniref:Uncharacterized protein n=1 Tax=Blattamonas nauphoetae TaxID=2049346 RepID=A0ABQ9XR42_9EUKA|nr:hypothetical protein BLNAU_11958 [Blattamonas nauphoetae]
MIALMSKEWQIFKIFPATDKILIGLDGHNTPYTTHANTIGCLTEPDDFLVCDTAAKNILGPAESIRDEDPGTVGLFATTYHAILAEIDRDSSSDWGSVICMLLAI